MTTSVTDAPGMLRVRLRDDQQSGTYPTVLVVAEHAERAAFARQALAIKLRELDAICAERDRLDEIAAGICRDCRTLALNCEGSDADLEAAIRGRLRRAV